MESNRTNNQRATGNPNMEAQIQELLSGRPRQYEKLSPAFMDQFSSKADLYSYMTEHLQVSVLRA